LAGGGAGPRGTSGSNGIDRIGLADPAALLRFGRFTSTTSTFSLAR